MTPRLRLGLLAEFGSSDGLGAQLDRWVEIARAAEDAGLGSIWIPEGFTSSYGANPPSALVVVAALVRRVRLDVGTGVVLLPAAHPLRLAYETALVDQLADGRLHLGVGIGDDALMRRFGVDRGTMADRADETLAALRALWSGSDGFSGQTIHLSGGIYPLPARPGGPPIWVGGYVKRAIERAARLGDAYYFGSASTLPIVERISRAYRRVLRDAGRDAVVARVAVNRFALIAETDADAQALARGPVGAHLQRYAASGNVRDGSPARTLSVDDAFDELQAAMTLIGSPQTVAERVRAYAAAGVTDVHLRVLPRGVPHSVALRTIDLAREVIRLL